MIISNFNFLYNLIKGGFKTGPSVLLDAPEPWQIGFQDIASPGFEGIVSLHDNVMFYLILIMVSVFWIMFSLMRYFSSAKSGIVYKYLNHGTIVPLHKYFYDKFSTIILIIIICFEKKSFKLKLGLNKILQINLGLNFNISLIHSYNLQLQEKISYLTFSNPKITFTKQWLQKREFHSSSRLKNLNSNNKNLNSSIFNEEKKTIVKIYNDAYTMKKTILMENKNKAGIYQLINKITGDFYIGQSSNLSARFVKYYSLSYLNSNNFIISRALLKYGYSNFSIKILEYCDKSVLLKREQYYLDELNPIYNILKKAGSSLGFKHSAESNLKKSQALKGKYLGNKSHHFGKKATAYTKELMSNKKLLDKNPMFGKTHSEETKNLIRAKKEGKVLSEKTKLLISQAHGNPVNLYEKNSNGEFLLIGRFLSSRKMAQFLGISGSTVLKYLKSGTIFKDKYKFSTK